MRTVERIKLRENLTLHPIWQIGAGRRYRQIELQHIWVEWVTHTNVLELEEDGRKQRI